MHRRTRQRQIRRRCLQKAVILMSEIRVTISYQLRQVIGDGSECMGCGDRVWLRGYAVVLFIGEREAGQYGSLLCQSCGDLVKSEVEDINS